MALKIFVVACFVAVTSAQYGGYAPKYAEPEPYDPNPQYSFHYAVNDPSTYDIKSQKEERNGDYVTGSYELYEPDGSKRTVEYYDQGYGFQAVVHKEPAKGGYAAPAYSAPAYSRPSYAGPSYSGIKYQEEERNGDTVIGSYQLVVWRYHAYRGVLPSGRRFPG
ncbi:hypothetical protein J6590_036938 [Homalodisca vitripennis]|nr:hypothetical protein J6590_036938 [Homalodisca vitripennis]